MIVVEGVEGSVPNIGRGRGRGRSQTLTHPGRRRRRFGRSCWSRWPKRWENTTLTPISRNSSWTSVHVPVGISILCMPSVLQPSSWILASTCRRKSGIRVSPAGSKCLKSCSRLIQPATDPFVLTPRGMAGARSLDGVIRNHGTMQYREPVPASARKRHPVHASLRSNGFFAYCGGKDTM
jgi:hypothetical protein